MQTAFQQPSTRWWNTLAILTLCLLCCWTNWLKLRELDSDQVRWLFEAGRAASGDFPYRDFSWQFPPFSLAFFAACFRCFGSTFTVAQIGLDLWSLVAVGLFLAVARTLFRESIAAVLTALFVVVGSATDTLFTLKLYTPAILTGIAGTLLMLLSTDGFLRNRVWRARAVLLFSVGSLVCLLSKPEFMLGYAGCAIALAAADRVVFPDRSWAGWFARFAGLMFASAAPASVVYLWLAQRAGWANVAAGVGGYGGAAHSCPWWPTGYGFFCVLGGIGEAELLLALLAWVGCAPWRQYRLLLSALAIPAFGAALYYTYLIRDAVWLYGHQPIWYRILHYMLWANTVIFPFSTLGLAACAVGLVLLIRAWHGGERWDAGQGMLFVVLATAASLSIRGLFGTLESPVPQASQASVPVWLLWSVAFVCPVLARMRGGSGKWVPGIILSYAAVLLLGFVFIEGRRPYPTLITRAGPVRLLEYEPAASVYKFVEQMAQPGETMVELPYGGGYYFAARLKSPLFSTQHILLPIPFHYLEDDLQRIKGQPPKLAVVSSSPLFGTSYGGHQGCAFPAIAWKPGPGDAQPGYVYPVVDFLQRNYTVARNFGPLSVLIPNGR